VRDISDAFASDAPLEKKIEFVQTRYIEIVRSGSSLGAIHRRCVGTDAWPGRPRAQRRASCPPQLRDAADTDLLIARTHRKLDVLTKERDAGTPPPLGARLARAARDANACVVGVRACCGPSVG